MDTDFIKCTNRVSIKGNNATGCLIYADSADIANCKFTKCQNWVGGDYGRYCSNYTYLLHLSSNSSVKDCAFDECYCEAKRDWDDHIESYLIACYKGKKSQQKKILEENTFIDVSDLKKRPEENVWITDREIE